MTPKITSEQKKGAQELWIIASQSSQILPLDHGLCGLSGPLNYTISNPYRGT
jgi:hypothetical protein